MSEKPRPSALPHLAACPRWVGRKTVSDTNAMDVAATEGTLFHAKWEALGAVPVPEWDAAISGDADLAPCQAIVVREGAEQVKDLFSLCLPVVSKSVLGVPPDGHYELNEVFWTPDGKPELRPGATTSEIRDAVYLEVGLDPGLTKPGTADLLVVYGNRAVLVDYKSNMVERSFREQQIAYVMGIFRGLPRVDYIENRIVSPRLYGAHAPELFERERDLATIEREISAIVDRAADPFSPGCPGEPCATCHGNGRCPYQAASLRDIPVDETGIVMPAAWLPVISAATPECRGQRHKLLQWLDKFVKAGKEDDKQWALENPDAKLPGFTKSVALGRLSLDKDRLGEANMMLATAYNLAPQTLLGLAVVDRDRAAEIVGLMKGISQDAAKADINKTLAPYMKRGQDIISFRAEKRAKLRGAEPKEIGEPK